MKKISKSIDPQAAAKEITVRLKALRNERNIEGMSRFGINPKNCLGVSMPVLRKMAKEYGHSQQLAELLWEGGLHEGRILASLVGEPELLSSKTAERWALDLDSWDTCDCFCLNLLGAAPFAWEKAAEWTCRDEEFVKRAGYAAIAVLAVHDKTAKDKDFLEFLPLIRKSATDERNFVKKAVNWALRQIGKRNMALNKEALSLARELSASESKSARWIGKDAARELESPKIQDFIKKHRDPVHAH